MYTYNVARIGKISIPECGVNFSLDWNQLVLMKTYSLTLLLYLANGQLVEICVPTSEQLHQLYEICYEQWVS
jgi:hypothetical protein